MKNNQFLIEDYSSERDLKVMIKGSKSLKERIKKICQFHGENLHKEDSKEVRKQFMVDNNHKVAYCRHGKVK